jgi:uncharacterized protein YndB with AHSA1/START domain
MSLDATAQPVIHGSFSVSVELDAPPDRVFAAYSEPGLRRRWFRIPGGSSHHELDFRAGGHEAATGAFAPSGVLEHLEYRSWFADIVPDERIVLSYTFSLDGVRRWTSLVTVELAGTDAGTRLTHTEQYAYLAYTGEGEHDVAHLKGGTRLQMNALAAALGQLASRTGPADLDVLGSAG